MEEQSTTTVTMGRIELPSHDQIVFTTDPLQNEVEILRAALAHRINTTNSLKERCATLRTALFGALRAHGTGEHPDQRSRFIDAGWQVYNETSQEIE